MKKKLLLICQHFYPEMVSTGLHMTELATYINNHYGDIEIEVLCSYPSKNIFKETDVASEYNGVRIIRKKSIGKEHGSVISRLLYGVSFFMRVLGYLLLHQKKYAGFIITTNPPFLGITTVLVKKIFRKPFFLIVYDVYPDVAVKLGILKANSLITKLWSFITVSILKNAKAFAVIGRDMERIVVSKAKNIQEKSVLIYNWSDGQHVKPGDAGENLFLQQHPELKDKQLFIYSGNMGRTHNMEDILAFAKECSGEKFFHFLIIGGGAKFKAMHEAANELSNITVLPYQPYELLPHLLSAATFCLVCLDKDFTGYSVPSKTYGIMAAGKPVIAFLAADSEIGLAVHETGCGFVISDNNMRPLKEKVWNALQTGEYMKMGERALKSFTEKYTLQIAAEKYYEAFKKL